MAPLVYKGGKYLDNESADDMDAADIHMRYLNFDPATQQQDEIFFSPLLNAALVDNSSHLQFGLFGGNMPNSLPLSHTSRIFYNVTCPSSIFICGSQGSGKSNTLACLLENCLIPSSLGRLPQPLTGIVFHFDTFTSDSGGLPCEAAFLASDSGTSVRVLCAQTNVRTIKAIYKKIPQVTVMPLELSDDDLNTRRMFDLMAVEDGSMPLYLHVVSRILRDMRLEQQINGKGFSYASFKKKISRADLTPTQLGPLSQRLDTLESFMTSDKTQTKRIDWKPKAGQLTVVDLSCPCITAEMACLLFNICLSLFLEQKSNVGKVVALDEAHKYMQESPESKTLTNSLLATIRLQRHLGVRVFISTQEPTVSTKLLDLCSMTVVHRFTSPDWLRTLRSHLAGVQAVPTTALEQRGLSVGASPIAVDEKNPAGDLFTRIMSLQTGQAFVFAPYAIMELSTDEEEGRTAIERLRHRPLKVKIRSRLTIDGGKTIMS
ncbi:uncharacterized protein CTRU02_202957 [Colletotrichum truncatum]|uniref:Uncharacterized protein n=1 Tax=Colletotrichum truncatum TaxID=5467 RepID=A0ACC3Z7Y1_COLTU